MVVDALTYHPSLTHLLKYLSTTVGRDKVLRLVQYFSRFYAWYLFRTNASPAEISPYEALKSKLGLARKLLRAGKNLEHLRAAAVAADAKNTDPVLRYTAVGRQLGYFGYLTFDLMTLLEALGARKPTTMTKTLQNSAYRCWAAGIIFSLIAQIYTHYRLHQREVALDKKDGESVVEGKKIALERNSARLQLFSDLCDLAVPTTALSWISLDDGIVGLAGTASSLIGMQTQWKKTV